MFIVEVIPLVRSTVVSSLTYYASEDYAVGSLVSVPVRKQTVQGLVVGSQPVSAAKAALRAATFSLRKLQQQAEVVLLPEPVRKTAEALAAVYPASSGAIIATLLPPDVREGLRTYPISTLESTTEGEYSASVMTGLTQDRYMSYRSLIRETFARKGSTLFVVPTAAHVPRALSALAHGIERRVITFAHTHTKKRLDASFLSMSDSKEAKLIITTPQYAFLYRADIATIVIESSGSPHYIDRRRPYLDWREALKRYARSVRANLVLGDLVVTSEDEVRRREEMYTTFGEHVQRVSFPAPLSVIERTEETTPLKKKYSILLPETVAAIERTLAHKGKIFLYAARRGIAPAIVCYDCGYLFRCPDSGSPYSLMRTQDGDAERRWFVSSTSGKRVRASDTCPSCGSWRLREQGFGIQLIVDELATQFPNAPLTVFDSTTATTSKRAEKLASDFAHSKGGIMVGTAMTLPYLPFDIDLSIVTSYEAARTMATWRADETMFSLLLALRERTLKETIVQTRTEIDPLIRAAERGTIDAFYSDEIAVRKALSYPPFSTFVLLTVVGDTEAVTAAESLIDATVRTHAVSYYNTPESHSERTVRHGLIRIPAEAWPSEELLASLRQLPPYVKIEINPDRIV